MDSTSVSLLRRINSEQHDVAWERFVELYAPLIFHWGKGRGLTPTDAAELVQEVLTVLVVKLPEFQYDPKRRFRGWLRTVTVNKANDFHRRNSDRPDSGQEETILRAAVASDVDLFEETEYRQFLVHRALGLMQTDFQDQTWQACWMHVVDGRSAAEVGRELGISANAVRVAKCRVLRRLREELQGLVD